MDIGQEEKKRKSSHHAGDFCMTRAHPLVVSQRNIFCVKVLEKLREVIRQLCQHVVVRLESPDEEICIDFELFFLRVDRLVSKVW